MENILLAELGRDRMETKPVEIVSSGIFYGFLIIG